VSNCPVRSRATGAARWLRVRHGIATVVSVSVWVYAATSASSGTRSVDPAFRPVAGAEDPLSTKSVDFWIGGTELKVPRNYFSFLPAVAQYFGNDMQLHDSEDKEEIGFAMTVLLPNLEARTQANNGDFDHSRLQDHLLVYVQNKSHTLTGKALFQQFYKIRLGQVTSGSDGYRRFKIASSIEMLFKGREDDPQDVLECSPIGGVPYPSCERTVQIAANMVMQYDFSRKYLPQMPNIERRIIDLLSDFRVNGLPFEIK
jgi:hypothetical protein